MQTTHRRAFEGFIAVLRQHVNVIVAESLLDLAFKEIGKAKGAELSEGECQKVVSLLGGSLGVWVKDGALREECIKKLRGCCAGADTDAPTQQSSAVEIKSEDDIVNARQQAKQHAITLGFNHTDQVKIMTAVSEAARNIYQYARTGAILITSLLIEGGRRAIEIQSSDRGPGIGNLEEVLSGQYRSKTGMGLGILSCKRLMDDFQITSQLGQGTRIVMRKYVI